MIVVYGRYRWAAKRIGFNNSYCLKCEAPCRSTQVKTFDVGHLYWLPVLPLGPRRRWLCDTCGARPDERVKTGLGVKILGTLMLAVVCAGLWATPNDPDAPWPLWIGRLGLTAIVIGIVVFMARARPEPKYADKLRAVPRAGDAECRFCATKLLSSPNWHCPGCMARRY